MVIMIIICVNSLDFACLNRKKDKRIQAYYNCNTVTTMEIINVRLPDKLTSDVDKLAKKHNLTRSEVIRQALTFYLHLTENVGTMLRPIVFQVKPAQITYTRRGDVSILKVPTGHAIVAGSTSSGAVGPKEMDKVKVDGRILGKFLARVALMDV